MMTAKPKDSYRDVVKVWLLNVRCIVWYVVTLVWAVSAVKSLPVKYIFCRQQLLFFIRRKSSLSWSDDQRLNLYFIVATPVSLNINTVDGPSVTSCQQITISSDFPNHISIYHAPWPYISFLLFTLNLTCSLWLVSVKGDYDAI